MEEMVTYFETIPSQVRAGIFVVGMVLFWGLEGIFPLLKTPYRKVRHAGLNLLLTSFNFAVAFAFAWILLQTSLFVTSNEVGVLQWFDMPLWVTIILGIILLDLVGAYFAHWTLHKVKWMWKFHVVHHSDQQVDVTTGFRHHPGEVAIRMLFTLLGVVLIGLPMGIIMLYQTLSLIFAQITHANVNIPDWLDKPLSYIFITPNMHKVHHHYQQPYTDSNYGNIFAFWDRLFFTFMSLGKKEIVYGVDTHMAAEETEKFGNLMRIPFQEYREPDGLKTKKV